MVGASFKSGNVAKKIKDWRGGALSVDACPVQPPV
jgi:hypothetical protein